jgi:hypothetical protein
MIKDITVLGLNEEQECVYSIDLPMIEKFRIPELISTCLQHAEFQGAVEVQINILNA